MRLPVLPRASGRFNRLETGGGAGGLPGGSKPAIRVLKLAGGGGVAACRLGSRPDNPELWSSPPIGLSDRAVPASSESMPARLFTCGLTWSASTAAVASALIPAGRRLPCPRTLPGAPANPVTGSSGSATAGATARVLTKSCGLSGAADALGPFAAVTNGSATGAMLGGCDSTDMSAAGESAGLSAGTGSGAAKAGGVLTGLGAGDCVLAGC